MAIDMKKLWQWKAQVAATTSLYDETSACPDCGHPWTEHFRKGEEGSAAPESSGCQHAARGRECRCFFVPPRSRYEERERLAAAERELGWTGRTAMPELVAEVERLRHLMPKVYGDGYQAGVDGDESDVLELVGDRLDAYLAELERGS